MGDTVITRGDVLSAMDSFNHFAIGIELLNTNAWTNPLPWFISFSLSLSCSFGSRNAAGNRNILRSIN